MNRLMTKKGEDRYSLRPTKEKNEEEATNDLEVGLLSQGIA